MATVKTFRENLVNDEAYSGIKTAADGIMTLPEEMRPAAYQAAIQGKDPNYITAMQIALFWREAEPVGMGRSQSLWDGDTVGIQHFARYQHSDEFKATTGVDQPDVSMTGDVLTINNDGKLIQLDYRIEDNSWSRDDEKGFDAWLDGEKIAVANLSDHPEVVAALGANRDAVIAAMVPFIQERIARTDGDVDSVNQSDLENILSEIKTSILGRNNATDFDGRVDEAVDALTILAMEQAISTMPVDGPNPLPEAVRNAFLNGQTFTSAKTAAEEVLTTAGIEATTGESPATTARQRYDFIVKFNNESNEPAETHDPNALDQATLNTEWAKFHGEGFDRELSAIELEAIALANVMYKRNAEGTGWEWDTDTEGLTLEEAQAHPDYQAVVDAHTRFASTPTLTIRAPAEGQAFGVIFNNIPDADTLRAYMVANGETLDAQIKDMLYGDDAADGITMGEASAAMDRINTQLEGVEAGSLEETVLRHAQELVNVDWDLAFMAENEPDRDAGPEAEAVNAADVEGAATVDPVRDVQRFALFARDGGYGELNQLIRSSDSEPGQISPVDGIPGVRTAIGMSIMLSKNFAQLNAMTTEEAITELEGKLQTDEALRTAVVSGLRASVGTAAEPEARAFLQARGVTLTEDLNADIETYVATLPDIEATVDAEVETPEASISIAAPSDNTKAFEATIAGIETTEQLEAYLATEGERIDTEMRAAMYNDITVVSAEDGISAEEATTVTGWIDSQLEGASDVERALLERARGLVETDAAAAVEATITVTANTARTDDDRVLDGRILEDAEEVIARAGGEVPQAGILAIIEGGPMLVRQIKGETIVTQLHRGNFNEVLGEGVKLDTELEGKLRERADMGETSVRFRDVTIGVDPRTANLLDTSTITIQQGRKNGLVNTFVSESTGKGVVIESEELADAIDHFDGRAPRDERFVTNYSLPGEFDSAAIARGLDALERAVDRNGAGSLSVNFVENANGTTAEINYGDGQKLEIPKGLYDAIMERAGMEATRDRSQVVEVSPPTAGMGA